MAFSVANYGARSVPESLHGWILANAPSDASGQKRQSDRFQAVWFPQNEILSTRARVTLGRNVVILRTRLGLTQEKLAEKVEVDRRYIQRIERGTANPGVDVIDRLRNALEAHWDEFLGP